MRLIEYEGLSLLSEAGIPTPRFRVVSDPDEAVKAAVEVGLPVVLKAQVLVGGRGKAGGVKFAESLDEVERIAGALFGSEIRGERVGRVMVAEAVKHSEELYLSIIVDRASNTHLILASRMGGVDVEELSKRMPEKLIKVSVDPLIGLRDWQVRRVSSLLDLPSGLAPKIQDIVRRLYEVYRAFYCDLAEINPLAQTEDGRLIALDAKLIIDDNAARMFGFRFGGGLDAEREAEKLGLNYVELEGDIGIICNGAGLTMATMDLIHSLGRRPACFLDLGGGASAEKVYEAVKFLFNRPHVKLVLLNVLAGITRSDEVAEGIVRAYDEFRGSKKIVVRLTGTREEEGRRILESRNIGYFTRMPEAAEEAVRQLATSS
ncbi:MAG: ADP-forming succinate--CoA ligase subunit beta [Nitrososphaerota archaeon]|nr:ADP-forming succinate--CoA ligase subunit beta [Candidatus Calditenuaceae archaeon]MDW8072832.1 ADP-forming succinate--CoA ligase subunit beta [Nitrososphaerota archaeon]